MWRKVILTAGAWLLLAPACLAATVTVTGQGGSERSALHQAMRQAVEQQVGVTLDSRSYVQNYRLINDRVYSQAEGYIRSYEVLESGQANGIYTVKIRADVQEQKLSTALASYAQKKAIVGANMQDPRVAVVAMDQDGVRYADLENVVTAGLREQGFTRLVDTDQLGASVRKRLMSADWSGDHALRQSLTSQFPMDYLVTAQVNKAVGSMADYAAVAGFQNLKKAWVTVAVRMMNVNTGELIYSGNFAGKSERRGPNALQEAVTAAAAGIPEAVASAALNQAANPEQHLTLIITGAKLGSISAATQYLEGLAGVNHVFVRSTSFGNMTVDVDFLGTAHDFAILLEGNGQTILELSSEYVKI